MPEIRRPAIKIVQGNRSLFFTSFLVRDFMGKDFYSVDTLDVEKSTGMQRLLSEHRARSFGKDIIEAKDHAFLPTSIFLATEKKIDYDSKNKELFFELDPKAGVCPLDVVDGQHRIKGIQMAVHKDAPKNDYLLDFPVSVIIADELSGAAKMLQFITVNIKQQKVSDGVAQHIISRFTSMQGVETLPHLPSWLSKNVEKGTDAKALDIVRYLNSEKTSVWFGKVQLADEPKKPEHIVNQSSFVKLTKTHILSRSHPLNNFEHDKRRTVLKNYWAAIDSIFVASSDNNAANSVFKYSGVAFFYSISAPIINHLARSRSYTADAIKKCILSTQEHLTPEAAAMISPDFWKTGGAASGLNPSAMAKIGASFTEALTKTHSSKNVKV